MGGRARGGPARDSGDTAMALIELTPGAEQGRALLRTLEACNAARTAVAEEARARGAAGAVALQRRLYRVLRDEYGLPAQLAVRAISTVASDFRRARGAPPRYAPHEPFPFDERTASFKGLEEVSLLTLDGRMRVGIRVAGYAPGGAGRAPGQADLRYEGGRFSLVVALSLPAPHGAARADGAGAGRPGSGALPAADDNDEERARDARAEGSEAMTIVAQPATVERARPGRPVAPTIAIVNRKGGSGKSTTTINLAGALAERGLAVLIVDLDGQASLTRLLLPEEPVPEGYAVGSRLQHPGKGLADLARPAFPGVHVVPGDTTIDQAGRALSGNAAAMLRLRGLLAGLEPGRYDAILLDTPPDLGFSTTSALLSADLALIPTMVAQPDLDALADVLLHQEEQVLAGGASRLLIVPNNLRHDGHDRRQLPALREAYGAVVAEPIPMGAPVKDAHALGQPVVRVVRRAPVADAYRALACRVLEEVSDVG